MSDGPVPDAGPGSGPDPVAAEGLRTYLRCPRRFEFAHRHGLEADDSDESVERRLSLLRTAICDALRRDAPAESLETAALDRLEALWDERAGRFHSVAQRDHERRVLRATVRAYVESIGRDHARGVERLREAGAAGGLVGPDLPLSATVSAEGEVRVPVRVPADYVYGDGSSLVAVRFVPTLRPLGLLRYRSEWEGDVADAFADHFDPGSDRFEAGLAGALVETAAALEGLRTLADRFGLEDRRCRFVHVPLVDRSRTRVNWASGDVEATIEVADLTDVYVDHHTYGMTMEHRNATVDARLESLVAAIAAGEFDPSDRWEGIVENVCGRCPYAVCCQEYVASEVGFDG